MVKVIDYKLRENNEGKSFYALTLQGGVEVVRSANGSCYATVKKTSIPTTFDEETCKSLVGTELPGTINKVLCEPYDFTIPQTGEVIQLSYKYEYNEQEQVVDFTKIYRPSSNGVHA